MKGYIGPRWALLIKKGLLTSSSYKAAVLRERQGQSLLYYH